MARQRQQLWAGLAMGLGALALGVPHPTYDDGRNLDILYHLSHGQGHELWHHGSPLFYTLWLPFYELGATYPALVWANGLLGLLGGWLLIRRLAPGAEAAPWAALAVVGWAWLPVSQANLAAFTIEAGSLLWLALALRARQRLWQGIWVGCAFLWNYKLALAGGIVLGYALYQGRHQGLRPWRYLYGLLLPWGLLYFLYLAYAGPAYWLRPAATYVGLLGRDANPAAGQPGADLTFYARYFWHFDAWPLVLGGLVCCALYIRRKGATAEVWLVAASVLAAHLMPKAPRMWMPVLPLLAGYLAWSCTNLTQPWRWAAALALLPWGAPTLWQTYGDAAARRGQSAALAGVLQAPCSKLQTPPAWEADTLYAYGSTLPWRVGGVAMPIATVLRREALPPHPHWLLLDGTSLYAGLAWPADAWLHRRYVRLAEVQLPGSCPTQWYEHAEYRGLPYRAIAAEADSLHAATGSVLLYHTR